MFPAISREFAMIHPAVTTITEGYTEALSSLNPDAVLAPEGFEVLEKPTIGLVVIKNAIATDFVDELLATANPRYALPADPEEASRFVCGSFVDKYDDSVAGHAGRALGLLTGHSAGTALTVFMNKYVEGHVRTPAHKDTNTIGPSVFMARGEGELEVVCENLSLTSEQMNAMGNDAYLALLEHDFEVKSKAGETEHIEYEGSDLVVFDGSLLTHRGMKHPHTAVRESIVVFNQRVRI